MYIGKSPLRYVIQNAGNGNCIFSFDITFEYPALGPRGLVPDADGRTLKYSVVQPSFTVDPVYPKRQSAILNYAEILIEETKIEMEGQYTFTYVFKDEHGQSLTSGGSGTFQVTLIDNPCVPNLTSLNNLLWVRTFILGDTDTITIDDTVVTNGDCKFVMSLVEADCL